MPPSKHCFLSAVIDGRNLQVSWGVMQAILLVSRKHTDWRLAVLFCRQLCSRLALARANGCWFRGLHFDSCQPGTSQTCQSIYLSSTPQAGAVQNSRQNHWNSLSASQHCWYLQDWCLALQTQSANSTRSVVVMYGKFEIQVWGGTIILNKGTMMCWMKCVIGHWQWPLHTRNARMLFVLLLTPSLASRHVSLPALAGAAEAQIRCRQG